MAEADAEIGPAHLPDPAADGRLLGNEPRIKVLLPDIHGAAHDDHQVEFLERRNRISPVQLDDMPVMAALLPEIAEYAGVLHGQMLKDQNTHQFSLDLIMPVWISP